MVSFLLICNESVNMLIDQKRDFNFFNFSIYITSFFQFFKAPICPLAEIHLFGKILAWLSVICLPLACCVAICIGGTMGAMSL